MRKITYLLIGMLFLDCGILKAQEQNEIEIKQNLGVMFLQNGKKLTPKQLVEITKVNPEAYQEMKIAKSNHDIGSIFSFAGGFMLGWTLGSVLTDEEPNIAIAGVGAGLLIISIPFSTSYSKHAKNAVGIYNNGLTQSGMRKLDFDLGFTASGIGITVNF